MPSMPIAKATISHVCTPLGTPREQTAIHGRGAGGFDLVGHDYRSRRSNARLAVPSAR
jgi:hypothetical protein